MKKFKIFKLKNLLITTSIILLILVVFKYEQNNKKDIFVPVLMYHNLDEKPDPKKITYTMKPKLFEKHMLALKAKGYTTVTSEDLNDYIYEAKPLPKKSILITLDDGKTNNYTYAYPVLKNLQMKATMFAIVHANEVHENEDYLDWVKLKEMSDSSFIDVQSHTYDLHHKIKNNPVIFNKDNSESKEVYSKRILDDLVLSKNLLEKNLGKSITSLAYPYGEYDEDIEILAKKAGYTQTYTTDVGIMKKTDSPYLIKRMNVDGLCSEKRLLVQIKLLEILASIFS